MMMIFAIFLCEITSTQPTLPKKGNDQATTMAANSADEREPEDALGPDDADR
jgi:hypothetical protein